MVWPPAWCSGVVDATRLDLPDDFVYTCLLLLLHERPADRRELTERLHRLGVTEPRPARVGSALRVLEEAGFARADVGGRMDGPDRTYRLTPEGAERLGTAADDLSDAHMLLGRFLARCGERLVS